MAELGLGTVQFGLDYGVTNAGGKVSKDVAQSILEVFKKSGHSYLDTASGYGCSESVLGELLTSQWGKIVTKISPVAEEVVTPKRAGLVKDVFYRSMNRLCREKLYALLTHGPSDLLKPGADYVFESMQQLRESGEVEKIGVSVYTVLELEEIMKRYDIDIVQVPLNIVDRRMLTSGVLAKAKQRGIEVHVRSVFFQGILLTDICNLPVRLSKLEDPLREWASYLQQQRVSALEGALWFCSQLDEVDVVVCGVAEYGQMRDLLHAFKKRSDLRKLPEFSNVDDHLLDPRSW